MSSLQVDVAHVVKKSAPEVWSFVVDGFFANHPKWDPAITECRRLDDGPLAPGSRGLEVRHFGGEQRATFEITEVAKQQRFSFRNLSGPFELVRTYTLAPADGGTRLAFSFQMSPKGAMKLLFPLFRRTIDRQVRANIARLAALLDGQL
jgi:hypothetical protein